jgi:hypothetical protein
VRQTPAMPKLPSAQHICYRNEEALGIENAVVDDNGPNTCATCANVHASPRPMLALVELQELKTAATEAKSMATAGDLAVQTALRTLQKCRARTATLQAVLQAAQHQFKKKDNAVGLASGEYHWCHDLNPDPRQPDTGPELLYCTTAACDDRRNHK